MIKKIAVATTGGDAPGMNAAIRAVTREAIYNGLEVIGIKRGYQGLIENQFEHLTLRSVSGIINRGGTILHTVRCAEIRTDQGMSKAVKNLKDEKIEGVVVIGGDGSLAAGIKLSEHGIPTVCIPASIDNDIYGTDETIGFDTAIDTAVEAIDKIRDTAQSHERVFIVEVMGREHGFLALSIGIASGAEFVLIPEMKYDVKKICNELSSQKNRHKTSIIMVFAEGVGNPYEHAEMVKKFTKLEVRVSSLGYIQRGGNPQARSRILASMFGAHAVKILLKGQKNRLVGIQNNKISDVPFTTVLKKEKKISKELYDLAKQLAI